VDVVIALRFGAAEAAHYPTSMLHLPGAGADAVDMGVLEPKCVVCNVFEHETPVAEFVMAALLDHTLSYGRMHTSFDGDRWSETYAARRPHGEVNRRILGLLGYGHIGKAVTQRAVSYTHLEQTLACCAAAVFDHRAVPIAAISVSGPAERVLAKFDRIGEEVASAARAISARLGFIHP